MSETLFNILRNHWDSKFYLSSFSANLISDTWLYKLLVIQNTKIRSIFKFYFDKPQR